MLSEDALMAYAPLYTAAATTAGYRSVPVSAASAAAVVTQDGLDVSW
jgi:hypothetical protein